MKIALCTIIKNEEEYLSNFLQHYEKIGVDSFIIIDNDDKEKCNYIPVKDNVIVIDKRGAKNIQISSYNYVYKLFKYCYDWFLFFDCDEYLEGIDNIKEYFEKAPKECEGILFNWKIFNDDNVALSEDKKVETFVPSNYQVKSAVKGGLNLLFNNAHFAVKNNYTDLNYYDCNFNSVIGNWFSKPVNDSIRLYHYRYRNFESKLLRGYPDTFNNNLHSRIVDYLRCNKFKYSKIKNLIPYKNHFEVSVLIPLRNRNISKFLEAIENYLICYNYEIIIAIQDDDLPFKRGQLLNVAAMYTNADTLILLDADIVLNETLLLNKYNDCYLPFYLRQDVDSDLKCMGEPYTRNEDFGGLVVVKKDYFLKCGGFSNYPIGWGYDDIIFANRTNLKKEPNNKVLFHLKHTENKDLTNNSLNNRTFENDTYENTICKFSNIIEKKNITYLYINNLTTDNNKINNLHYIRMKNYE